MTVPVGALVYVNWGDGSSEVNQRVSGRFAHSAEFSHTYRRWGRYELRIRVVDERGRQRLVHEGAALAAPVGMEPGGYSPEQSAQWDAELPGYLHLFVD